MNKLTLVPILLLFCAVLYSQENVHVLLKTWKESGLSDSASIAIHEKVTRKVPLDQIDSFLQESTKNLPEKEFKELLSTLTDERIAFGSYLIKQGRYRDAEDVFMNLLLYHEEEENPSIQVKILNNLSNVYFSQGNISKQLDVCERLLEIKTDSFESKYAAYRGFALAYMIQGNFLKCREYLFKIVEFPQEHRDSIKLATTISNIGASYYYEGKYPDALSYYQKCLDISNKTNNSQGKAIALLNMGEVYEKMGRYQEALELFEVSLEIFSAKGKTRIYTINLVDIGKAYLGLKDRKKSTSWCLKGYETAVQVGSLEPQRDAAFCLYQNYEASYQHKKALDFYLIYKSLDDSLRSAELAKKLQVTEINQQLLADSLKIEEQKLKTQLAHEEELRKKERTRNILLGLGALLILLSVGLVSRVQFIRKAKNQIEKEKERSEGLLLNILPAEIAEELKQKGSAEARNFELVSIMFTDFKEFTQTAEHLSAKELVDEIHQCFKAFDAICSKYGIEKIKTIGDSYMAASGLPISNSDSTKNAVLALLEMQEFIKNRFEERKLADRKGFEMRAGIHTGPVVAGIVGIKKFQYDIWGDTVNIASRMESHGTVGKVNISNDTYLLLKDDPAFNFIKREEMEVKGKGKMRMWYVDTRF